MAREIVNGVEVNFSRLKKMAEAQNDASAFYLIDYSERACPFLKKNGLCSVYENRPSVCRTNYVVSDPISCETKDGGEQPVRLLNTYNADMVLMASFKNSKENGALSFLVWKVLKRLTKSSSDAVVNKA